MNVFERFGQWAEDNPYRLNSIVVSIILIVSVPFAVIAYADASWFFGPDPTGIWAGVFTLLLIAPLYWRRSAPLQAAVMIYFSALLHMLMGPPLILPGDLSVLVVLYSVTVFGQRWMGHLALIFALSGALIFGFYYTKNLSPTTASLVFTSFTMGLLFITTWAIGLMRKARIDGLRTLREKNRVLEVEREQQLQLGAVGERARIAREMHDIVAHSLSVMIAQADGGKYAAKVNPDFAETALGTIAETGRAALADMRRLLGVLREDANAAETSPLGPQPASGNIEGLIEQIRMSGVRVSLVKMGAPRTLPPGAGLTLYRICQESLTNILKHAGPDPTVTVLLSWGRANLLLEVEDDGRGAASSVSSDGAGMGLIGMKERAALFGGTVKAGPKPGGGYRVQLELPLPEISDETPDSSTIITPSN